MVISNHAKHGTLRIGKKTTLTSRFARRLHTTTNRNRARNTVTGIRPRITVPHDTRRQRTTKNHQTRTNPFSNLLMITNINGNIAHLALSRNRTLKIRHQIGASSISRNHRPRLLTGTNMSSLTIVINSTRIQNPILNTS